ncbi:hypothetical protein SAMN04488090_2118 [Siphonobacter aquaeclarae]|uniref:Uncharacterized protein n=1 Tax=Siphonobacter aquaeclarae TaxID=563176 RepID=A0A1G9PCR3_9BACT|nr:hypothetical protein SAMN04488090_2118 [Siphonobacter aquaeclarae]
MAVVDLNDGVEVIGNVIHFSEADRRVGNNAVRFAERLVKAGWKVNRHALGQPWTHEMVPPLCVKGKRSGHSVSTATTDLYG